MTLVAEKAGFFKQNLSETVTVAKGLDDRKAGQQGHQRPVMTAIPGKLQVRLCTYVYPVIPANNEGIHQGGRRLLFKSDQHQQACRSEHRFTQLHQSAYLTILKVIT